LNTHGITLWTTRKVLIIADALPFVLALGLGRAHAFVCLRVPPGGGSEHACRLIGTLNRAGTMLVSGAHTTVLYLCSYLPATSSTVVRISSEIRAVPLALSERGITFHRGADGAADADIAADLNFGVLVFVATLLAVSKFTGISNPPKAIRTLLGEADSMIHEFNVGKVGHGIEGYVVIVCFVGIGESKASG